MPTIIVYPLDLTGTSPDNLVIGEPHDVALVGNRAFVPNNGPFFAKTLVVRNRSTGEVLVPKVHYKAVQLFAEATLRTGKEICSVIIVEDQGLGIEFEIDYQVLGGDYSTSVGSIQQMIDTLVLDARPVKWGDIIGKLVAFPSTPHLHDVGDLYGFEFLVVQLEAIRQAIIQGNAAQLDELIAYIDSQDLLLSDRITAVSGDLTSHINDTNNPHSVSKTQVGLGNVENFAVADQLQAEAGAANTVYMTPLRSKQLLDTHANRTDNPHQVTKAQVGLNLVANFAVASLAEALAGLSNSLYMTPFLTRSLVADMIANATPPPPPDIPPTARYSTSGSFTVGSTQTHSIIFNDESSAGTFAIATWFWEFGDGTTSSVKTPAAHTYVVPAGTTQTFITRLTVTDSNGVSATTSISISLTKNAAAAVAPVADFNSTGTLSVVSPADHSITFTDASTMDPSSTIVNWLWDFGDTTTSTVANPPAHTYSVPIGTSAITVKLTVTAANGLSSTKTRVISLVKTNAVTGPTANFNQAGSLSVVSPATHSLTFTDSSTLGSTAIVGWAWNFGDGTTSNLQNPPAHAYTVNVGTTVVVVVSLTVTDVNGLTSVRTKSFSLSKTQAIQNPPTANFSVSGATTVVEGSNHVISVSDFSTAGDAAIVSWSWNWGDSTTSTGKTPAAHTYVVPVGTTSRTITLTVTDANGNSNVSQNTISLVKTAATGPEPSFARSGTTTVVEGTNHVISVSGVSNTNTSSTVVSWLWDWGDGTTSTGVGPAPHTYVIPVGTFTFNIKLTATDTNGKTGSFTSPITLTKTAATGPSANFSTGGTLNVLDTSNPSVTVTDASLAGANPIVSYIWNWGDGSTNSSGIAPAPHTYIIPLGATSKTITLTVTDSLGKTSSFSSVVNMSKSSAIGPTSSFSTSGSLSVVEGNNHVISVANSSIAGDAAITNWSWNWGDGSGNSTGNAPGAHTYVIPVGTASFTINLTVTDANGKTSSSSKTVALTKTATTAPNAAFTTSGTLNVLDTTNPSVSVLNSSTPGTNAIDSYSWDWGDGSPVSTGSSPGAHTYVIPVGTTTKTITLSVTDTAGKVGTTTRTVTLTKTVAAPPAANFGISGATTVVEGSNHLISVSDTSTPGSFAITSWVWDWGDGSPVSIGKTPAAHTYTMGVGSVSRTISLTVTDSNNKSSTLNKTITLTKTAAVPPSVAFTVTGSVTNTTTFTETVSVLNQTVKGTGTITNWTWDWGDGSPVSTVQNPPAHEYVVPQFGTTSFTITLTASDSLGKSGSASNSFTFVRSTGGGGGGCVSTEMYMDTIRIAGDIQIGDWIDGSEYNPDGIILRQVRQNRQMLQPCLRMTTVSGISIIASTTTPMTLQDMSCKMFPEMLGELVLVDDNGVIRWEEVISLEDVGEKMVVLFNVDDQSYFAGEIGNRRIATHNIDTVKQ